MLLGPMFASMLIGRRFLFDKVRLMTLARRRWLGWRRGRALAMMMMMVVTAALMLTLARRLGLDMSFTLLLLTAMSMMTTRRGMVNRLGPTCMVSVGRGRGGVSWIGATACRAAMMVMRHWMKWMILVVVVDTFVSFRFLIARSCRLGRRRKRWQRFAAARRLLFLVGMDEVGDVMIVAGGRLLARLSLRWR